MEAWHTMSQFFLVFRNLKYFRPQNFSRPSGAILAEFDWFWLQFYGAFFIIARRRRFFWYFVLQKRILLWFPVTFLKISRKSLDFFLGRPKKYSPNLRCRSVSLADGWCNVYQKTNADTSLSIRLAQYPDLAVYRKPDLWAALVRPFKDQPQTMGPGSPAPWTIVVFEICL